MSFCLVFLYAFVFHFPTCHDTALFQTLHVYWARQRRCAAVDSTFLFFLFVHAGGYLIPMYIDRVRVCGRVLCRLLLRQCVSEVT